MATDGSGTEAADGSPDFTFTFTRTGDTSQALSVNYNVFWGGVNSAFPGQDINTASSGIVLFAAGSATATLTFDAIDDLQAENTESFTVSISPDLNFMNPSYIVGAQSSATGTVIDNDGGALPVVSIADAAAVSEGGVLSFTLTRTGDTAGPLTVNLAGGGAAGGIDYTAPTSVTFAAGSATAVVNVQTLDDTQDEANETVTLSIGPGSWLCEAGRRRPPALFWTTMSRSPNACDDHGCGDGRDGTEAADGSPDFTFTFTRTGDTSQALSVNYNVFREYANWASLGQDINTASSGIVLFEAGSATATLTFDAINDLLAENTESFTVSISSDIPTRYPRYTVGAQSSATGTVIDNDGGALPSVSIADAARGERRRGAVVHADAHRRYGRAVDREPGQLGRRIGQYGYDYTAPTSVTFAAGSATAVVNVQTLDDTQDEADETVTLSIGQGFGYVSGQTQATGTILDNDAPFTGTPATITVAATDGSGTEAADGSPDFTFTFTRTGDTSQALSVNYNVFREE